VAELDAAALAALLAQPGVRAHFVGVGGAGMAPLATIARDRGWTVSGCDLGTSETVRQLVEGGIAVAHGHDAAHVADAELLVISSAVPNDAPEVAAARAAGLPIVKRAVLTGALTRASRAICIAGTHGKTTTTSMTAALLLAGGIDASVLVGGVVPGIGVGGRNGQDDVMVVESDEFDRSFLNFRPYVAVVTNIEADHLDYYGSLAAIEDAFTRFLALIPPGGRAIVCRDDPGAMKLAPPDATTYGFHDEADWRALGARTNEIGGMSFELAGPNGLRLPVDLAVPGRHNVANAVAAAAAGHAVELDLARALPTLAEFRGARRRFDLRGEADGVAVYDDYSHHPTEVRAALAAARQRTSGQVWEIFQPHTYGRTASLFDDFAAAFGDADHVLMLDVYSPAGREQPIPEVSSDRLVAAMRHPDARHVRSFEEAAAIVAREAQPGDLVFTMGAGDVTNLAPLALDRLRQRAGGAR
jgi:UDP-N-acetylmuramate--alanine ligase